VSTSVPHEPSLPDSCQLDRLIRDWCDAVDAYQRKDPAGVSDAFSPPDLGEVETYTRLLGLVMIAAELCGVEQRKAHPPNPFGFYALRVEDVTTGRSVDPDQGVEEANTVAAGRLIIAAANQDHEQVEALARAHMPFDGDMKRSGVLLDLLSIYCAMAGSNA
jgi:hypothetical protein